MNGFDEWGVVTVLIALIGLFVTVGKPMLSLNKNITSLNVNIEHNSKEIAELKTDLKKQNVDAHNSHQRLWDHNHLQDKQLQEHEVRLGKLEQ